jgi:hypothetical protein
MFSFQQKPAPAPGLVLKREKHPCQAEGKIEESGGYAVLIEIL